MYSNTQQYPNQSVNQYYGRPQHNMYNTYNNDDRLIGGFAFPFLLGGVTGAALAPSFWRPGYGYNRPYYPYYPPYYYY